VPRRNALIVAGVGLAVVLAAIVLLWSKGGAGNTRTFCDTLRNGENPLDVFDRYDPANVTAARADLQRGTERLRELQRAAPRQIADDMDVLVKVADDLVQALTPETGTTKPFDFRADFDRVSAASGNVTRFASSNCGIALDSGSAPPTTAQN
jgi:hypothetical protein